MASRRFSTTVQHLVDDPVAAVELAERLDDETIAHLAAALRDEARRRAVAAGDHDAVIEAAFEQAFGRDGLGVGPWVPGEPGGGSQDTDPKPGDGSNNNGNNNTNGGGNSSNGGNNSSSGG